MALGNEGEHFAAIQSGGAIIQDAVDFERHADKDEHPRPFRRGGDLPQRFRGTAQQYILPEQVAAGIAADAKLGKDEQFGALFLCLLYAGKNAVCIETGIRDADARRRRGDPHKSVLHGRLLRLFSRQRIRFLARRAVSGADLLLDLLRLFGVGAQPFAHALAPLRDLFSFI